MGATPIWFSQAQVRFYLKSPSAYDGTLPSDLTFPFNVDVDGSRVATGILQRIPAKASLTILFVPSLVNNKGVVTGVAPYGGPYVYITDLATSSNAGLAHEAGHSLNRLHIIELNADQSEKPAGIKWRSNLMYPNDYSGKALNKNQADGANAFAKSNFN